MKKIIFSIIVLASLVFCVPAFAKQQIPNPEGYVNDWADVLDYEWEQKIETQLEQYDKDTSNQIVIVTLDSLQGDGETIEQYSIRLAEAWEPGTEEKDNGVIMLFVMDDREMRIEVGMGLEGDLTDLESHYIIEDIITPAFKEGNYEEGIENGLNKVIEAIGGELEEAQEVSVAAIVTIIIIVLLIIIVLAAISSDDSSGLGGVIIGSTLGSLGGGKSSGGGFKGGGGGFSGGGSSGKW